MVDVAEMRKRALTGMQHSWGKESILPLLDLIDELTKRVATVEVIEALDATGEDWVIRNYDEIMMRRQRVCELYVIEAIGATTLEACQAALAEYHKRKNEADNAT